MAPGVADVAVRPPGPAVKAIVLAGGLGTRLREAVPDVPKVLGPVAGHPFLDYVLCCAVAAGADEAVVAAGYRADLVAAHLTSRRFAGMPVELTDEGQVLRGTAGAARLALEALADAPGDPVVLVLNGDTYCEFDAGRLSDGIEAPADAALVVVAVPDASRYGRVQFGTDGLVTGFEEKGRSGPGHINAGVYAARRSVWRRILPDRIPCSLEREVLPALAGRGLRAVATTGRFVDMGVPEDYRRAQTLLEGRLAECR